MAGAPAEQDGGADHDSGQREAHLAQVPPLPQEDLRQESLGEPSYPATSDLFFLIGLIVKSRRPLQLSFIHFPFYSFLFFNIMHNNLIPSIYFLIRGNVVQLQWPIIILMLC